MAEGLEVGSVWVSVVPRLSRDFGSTIQKEMTRALGQSGKNLGAQMGNQINTGLTQALARGGTKGAIGKIYADMTAGMRMGNDALARTMNQTSMMLNNNATQIAQSIRSMLLQLGRSPAEVDRIMRQMQMAWGKGGEAELATLKKIHGQLASELARGNQQISQAVTQRESLAKRAMAAMSTMVKPGSAPTGGGLARPGGGFSGVKGFLGAGLIPISPALGMAAFLGGPWAAAGAAVGLSIASGVREGFESGMKLEMAQIRYETLLGPIAGQEALTQVQQFAAKTPFSLDAVRQSFTDLYAAGIQTKEIIPLLSGLGDTLSALGGSDTESMQRATLAIKQIVGTGRAYAQDLRQLEQLGIPIYAEIAAQMDVTQGEARQLASEGKVTSDILIDSFTKPLGPLARFNGLMEEANLTYTVALSNFKDTLSVSFGEAFLPVLTQMATILPPLGAALAVVAEGMAGLLGPLLDSLAAGLPAITAAFELLTPAIAGIGRAVAPILDVVVGLFSLIAPLIGPVVSALGTLTQALGPVVTDAIAKLLPVAQELGRVFGPPLQQAAIAIALAFEQLLPVFTALAQPLTAVIQTIGGALTQGLQAVLPFLVDLGRIIAETLTPLLPVLANIFQAIAAGITQALPVMLPAITAIQQAMSDLIVAIGPSLGALITALVPVFGVLANLVRSLAPVLSALAPVLAQIINTLAATLVPILYQLAPVLTQIVQLIAQQALVVMPPLAAIIDALAPILVLLGQAIGAMLPLLSAFLQLNMALLPIIEVLTPVITFLAEVLSRSLSAALAAVIGLMYLVVAAISKVVEWAAKLVSVIPGVSQATKDAVQGAADAIVQSRDDLYAAAGQAAQGAIDGFAGAAPAFYSTGYSMGQSVVAGFNAATEPIMTMADLPDALAQVKEDQKKQAAATASTYVPSYSPPSVGSSGGSGGSGGSAAAKAKPTFAAILGLPFGPESEAERMREQVRDFIATAVKELREFNDYTAKFHRELERRGKQMVEYTKRWDELGQKIAYTKTIADSLKGFASPVNALRAGYNSSAGIQRRSTDLLQQLRKFGRNLKDVRALGASGALIAQIVEAGPEEGNRLMEALLSGTKGQSRRAIDALDRTMKATAKVSEKVGLFAANSAEQLGTDMAGGIIRGLKERQRELEKVMRDLARAMTKAVQHELGIKSPSRVFIGIGENVSDGMVEGIAGRASTVEAALAGSVPRQVRIPNISGTLGAGGGGGPTIVHVYLGNELVTEYVDTRIEYRDRETAAAIGSVLG